MEPEARMDKALEQARQGDNSAFAEIVREHQGTVFSIGWHYLGDSSLAEDLGQEVFLQLYKNLRAFQSASHLAHWVRRVAVHRCIDHTRRKRFRRELPLEDGHGLAANAKSDDSLLSERLRQTVTQLREKERMVILLRYQEEMALAEIADVLSMPMNTVKSTLFRALRNLRGKLGEK